MKPLLSLALVITWATTAAAEAPEAPKPPGTWTCEPSAYSDGVCDCGCGAKDLDCPAGLFEVCERSACPEGRAPWEHEPWMCMSSVCGDGWLDERAGEVCDDGNAIQSGGCNADCTAVNSGYLCGVRAEKCSVDPDAEPDPTPDDEPTVEGGCTSATTPWLWALLPLALYRRRP